VKPGGGRSGRRRIRLAAGIAGALVLGTWTMGCAAWPGGDGPVLRVGVSPDSPPVVFEQDGEIVGIEADLARLVGAALDRRIVFERIPFGDLLEALARDEVDVVMSGLSITPERAERVRFTAPYMEVGQLAMIRSADVARFGRIGGLRRSGARVGYERETTGERFVAEELPRSRSFAFDSVEEGLRSLRAGRIDYFLHDAPTIWMLAGEPRYRELMGLYQPLTEERLAWAVSQDDPELQRRLDALVRQWRSEGRIEPILDRWIPVRVTVR